MKSVFLSLASLLLIPGDCSTSASAADLILYHEDLSKRPASQVAVAREFSSLPGASAYVTTLQFSLGFERYINTIACNVYPGMSNPIGGWCGNEFTYDGVLYNQGQGAVSVPPGIGMSLYAMPGDSAQFYSAYFWHSTGVIAGKESPVATHAKQANYWKSGPNMSLLPSGRPFMLSFEGATKNFYASPPVKVPGQNFAKFAMEGFDNRVDGIPIYVHGVYVKDAPDFFDKSLVLVEDVKNFLHPDGWLIDWNVGENSINATATVLGADKIVPVLAVTLDGTLENYDGTVEPSMTPAEFVAWLSAHGQYPTVAFQSQADRAAVVAQLKTLLPSPQQ